MKLVRTTDPIISALKDAETVILDTETSGLHPHRDGKILGGIGIKVLHGPSFYLPFRHSAAHCRCTTGTPQIDPCRNCEHPVSAHKKGKGCAVDWPEVNADIGELLKLAPALKGKTIVMHHAPFDLATTDNEGLDLTGERVLCTMVLWRLISDNEPSYALKKLTKKYIDPEAYDSEKFIKGFLRRYHGSSDMPYTLIPAQLIVDYVNDDLNSTETLFLKALPKIEEYGLTDLLAIEEKVTKSLYRMERRGFPIDRAWVEERVDRLAVLLDEAKEACRKHVGKRLGVRLKQKARLKGNALQALEKAHETYLAGFDALNVHHVRAVYEGLGTKSWKPTDKGNQSWDNAVLLSLVHDGDSLAAAILRHRTLNKIKVTYYDNLLSLADPNNIIHCSIRQSGTKTGRMSAANPNLTNLPKQENLAEVWSAEELAATARNQAEMAKAGRQLITGTDDLPFSADPEELNILSEVRGSFVPRKVSGLLLADWDQVELRILAHYANEETMIRAFHYGLDIHAITARAAFGERPRDAEEAKRWRGDGKTFNFALVFRMGLALTATRLRKSREEAREFREAFFARYPRVREFTDLVERTLQRRLVATCLKHGTRDLCLDGCEEPTLRRGWVKNLWGRRRMLWEENESLGYKSDFYKGVNVLVQGSAGDLMRDTLWQLDDALSDTGAYINIPVHDEFIIDTPIAELSQVAGIVVPTMETCPRLKVPLKVSLQWAPERWSQAIDLDCPTCHGLGKVTELSDDELFEAVYAGRDDMKQFTCPECDGRRFLLEKATNAKT